MVQNALVNCSIFGFAAVFPLNSSLHCPWTGSVGASQERMNTACHMLSVRKHISVWGTTAQPCSCRNAEVSFYTSCSTWHKIWHNVHCHHPGMVKSLVVTLKCSLLKLKLFFLNIHLFILYYNTLKMNKIHTKTKVKLWPNNRDTYNTVD